MEVVYGSPGTGKTTYCLGRVEALIDEGVDPRRIAYVSFTRRAVQEARERAASRFGLDPENDLPWFRTLHSLALHALGASPAELMDKRSYRELGSLLGEDLSGHDSLDEDGEPRARKPASTALFLDQLARVTGSSLERCYNDLPLDIRPRWPLVKRAAEAYQLYKSDTGALDFTDLLEHVVEEAPPLGLEAAIIDEAQDLSPLQWRVAERLLLSRARRLLVVGDPMQALFRWAGADPERLTQLPGDHRVLPHSHRLPQRVYGAARRIAARCGDTTLEHVTPRDEAGGVHVHGNTHSLPVRADESWLILARHGRHVRRLASELRSRGLPYETRTGRGLSWDRARAINAHEALRAGQDVSEEYAAPLYRLTAEPDLSRPWTEALPMSVGDRAYAQELIARGVDLEAEPSIRLSTIHGAKGAEADHVVLDTTLSARSHDTLLRRPADEHRVFYVGVTRARRTLRILAEPRRRQYPVPLS